MGSPENTDDSMQKRHRSFALRRSNKRMILICMLFVNFEFRNRY